MAVWTEATKFGPWSYRAGIWAGGLAPHLFSRSAPARVRRPRGQCLPVLHVTSGRSVLDCKCLKPLTWE